MKIFLCVLFITFFYENVFTQNWMPLEVGNKTLERGIQWVMYGNQAVYCITKVEKDTLIDNLEYFFVESYNYLFPNYYYDNKWLRYDIDSQKVYWRGLDTTVIFMDFNLGPGQIFHQYNPFNGTTTIRTVYETTRTIFGEIYNVKGFLGSGQSFLMGEWVENIGIKPKVVTSGNVIQVLQYENQDTIYLSYPRYPDFNNFTPVLETSNLIFDFNFWVKHPYTYYASLGVQDFIKDVYFDCFYKSESDSISAGRLNSYYVYTPPSQHRQVVFNLNPSLLANGYSFYYKVTAVDKGLIPNYLSKPDTGYYKLVYIPTDVESEKLFTTEFTLSQNYPNPFNPSTKISWQAPVGSWQTLKVYDILGNEVVTLVNEYRDAGSYKVEFQSAVGSLQLASGIYYYQLRAGDYVETKKMILLK